MLIVDEEFSERRIMKDFVEFIAKGLVDNPSRVKVNQINGGRTTIYELTVAREDLGKIIGKQGRTAQAIRTLLAAAAAREGKKARHSGNHGISALYLRSICKGYACGLRIHLTVWDLRSLLSGRFVSLLTYQVLDGCDFRRRDLQ